MVNVQFPASLPSGGGSLPVRELFPGAPVVVGPSRVPAPASAEAGGGAAAPSEPSPHVSRQILDQALKELNHVSDSLSRGLKFGIYDGTDQFYVQVLDRQSNRVVKVMPSEDFLKLHARLQKAVGVLLDEMS